MSTTMVFSDGKPSAMILPILKLRNVLVPLDGSSFSERALPYAAELTGAAGAQLSLIHTPETHHHLHRPRDAGQPENAADYLRGQAERLGQSSIPVDTRVADGEQPEALLAEIERRQPDIVVMATHGRPGLGDWLHGSLIDAVVGRSGRPVLLVRAWPSSNAAGGSLLRGKLVLVSLDGSRFAESALPSAIQLARTLESELLLLQAIVPVHPLPFSPEMAHETELDQAMQAAAAEESASTYLAALRDRLAAREPGLRVSSLAGIGELTTQIRELNAAADAHLGVHVGLVVVATHARSGVARVFLGSEVDAILRHDDFPLVVVRPQYARSAAELPVIAGGGR